MKEDNKIVIGVIGFLLMSYVLSPPPVVWLMQKFNMPFKYVIYTMYVFAPLQWLYDNVTWVKHFYDWYGELLGLV